MLKLVCVGCLTGPKGVLERQWFFDVVDSVLVPVMGARSGAGLGT